MKTGSISSVIILGFVLLWSVSLSACNKSSVDSLIITGKTHAFSTPLDIRYPVDAIFTDLYSYLGGEKIIGPAITPLKNEGNLKTQFVEAGLMVYDPLATPSERYRMAPLALGFKVSEPGLRTPTEPSTRVVDGHLIFRKFLPFYERLGGARFVGRPLTEARYNFEKERIEQYFENLGFYILDNDVSQTVQLLAYGAFVCDQQCRYQPKDSSIPILKSLLPEPFASEVARLGVTFVGRTISEPTLLPDGREEVIFENIVLIGSPGLLGHVSPRPIIQQLGIEPHPTVQKTIDPLMLFLPTDGEKGYQIPIYFYNFIDQHGGLEISGVPISEVFMMDEGLYRQCFTNICLDYEIGASQENRLQVAPMGLKYKEISSGIGITSLPLENIQIMAWERYAVLTVDMEQEIFAAIFEGEKLLKDREPVLILMLPDSTKKTFHFPPTNELGQTSLVLPPTIAPSGTLIAYQVCLSGSGNQRQCEGDNYMIWNFP